MADQVTGAAKGAQDKAGSVTKGTPIGGVQEKVKGATNGALGAVENVGNKVVSGGQRMLDRVFPPEKRAAAMAKVQSFVLANPKLSTFLGMNIALTGIPLALFILFSITVFLFALIVALVLGLLAAVLFTLFAVGTALLVVFPTIFFTTGVACFLFLWGLGGYYILRWANGDKKDEQAGEGSAVGDKLNRLTGGKLDGLMEGARKQEAKKDITGYNDRFTKPEAPEAKQNGSAEKKEQDGPEHKPLPAGDDIGL